MSVALAPLPVAVYREEQRFSWWVYGLMILMVAISIAGIRSQRGVLKEAFPILRNLRGLELPLYVILGIILPTVIIVGLLHMTTVVTPGKLSGWFGWFPTYRFEIPIGEIHRVEIVTYSAWVDHGFWGIRHLRDGTNVYTARGTQAVHLHMRDGSQFLIGSQRAEELANLLELDGPGRAC